MTPEEADAMQEWKDMDGSDAYLFILNQLLFKEHANNALNISREMMHAWLRANQPVIEAQEETKMVGMTAEDANNYHRILTILGMEDEGDPVAMVKKMQSTILMVAKFF